MNGIVSTIAQNEREPRTLALMKAGVVPVKALSEAKSRLIESFGDEGRHRIANALLEDTFDLCSGTDFLDWWIVTPDEDVASRARARGFGTLGDRGQGLNTALRDAAAELKVKGFESMVVVPADIPLAYPGDMLDLMDTGSTSDVVVVPSGNDGGTNGLYLSPVDLLDPQFGPDSMRAHISDAERAGHRCAILALPRLALDIDTAADVTSYLGSARLPENATTAILRDLVPRP